MSELLPCPFCGGNAALSWDDTSKLSFGECIECGTESGHAENYDNAKAVEQWNKRSPSLLPPLTASIAIVKERDAYRADAMRYRWLRESAGSAWPYDLRPVCDATGYRLSYEDLDRVVDAAIAAEKQK